MESLIARLLEDFEDGRMNRRQLIQSLAMAAMAAPAAATVSAQTADRAPWKTTCLDHISLQVTDFKRSAAFYQSLMGWESRGDGAANANQASLTIPNVGNIILRNRRQPPAPATGGNGGADGQPARPPVNAVIDHISFGVTPWDTQAVEAELKRRGLSPRPDMVGDNFKSFHVKDPDGWDLQISNSTGATRG